ncbi:MAG TPA: phosphoribosylamine--glycine ligase [Thermodesulfovibrionia bacterium]|nr:phosphoribosylamine--glycine ligase [Thermodesulfovibrionia bacterium]
MKVMVIGSGGREHALVWKLAKSPKVDRIYCVPGNGGIAEIAECMDINMFNFQALLDFVRYEWIELTIVGPEVPLVRGIVDAFERDGHLIFGPNSRAARLEGSKVFAKDFMKRHGIPTAQYKVFSSSIHAHEYVRLKGAPLVIKADGLAAGKGVFVCRTTDEAIEALNSIMKDKIFGKAGEKVVIEDCLSGEEVSFMVLTDSSTIVPMASSQDHKQAFDLDQGPNTGGMGAYSPAPIITETLQKEIMDTIIVPAVHGLQKEGIVYKGVLYAGLMISGNKPYVLEFNCRFGDPEAQVILSRLDNDLVELAKACAEERLHELATAVSWTEGASVCVVLAAQGYPGSYPKGEIIQGLETLRGKDDIVVFHSGTAIADGALVTSGGRVLGVTGTGSNIKDAIDITYEAVKQISWNGMHYRKDIGAKALNYNKTQLNQEEE